MKRELKPCGTIQYNSDIFDVYLETPEQLVWLNKPQVEGFGFENYNSIKASDQLEALQIARKTLKLNFN